MIGETMRSLEGSWRFNRERAEALLAALDAGAEVEEDGGRRDPAEVLDELPLSVEVVRHVEILLTYGGPGITLDATLDDAGEVSAVHYVSAWGSDRFERDEYEGSPLFRLAQYYAEVVG